MILRSARLGVALSFVFALALVFTLGPPVLPASAATPVYDYVVVKSYPHDPAAFTEGLFYEDGWLFESTGLEGRSSLRRERLETGEVVQARAIAPKFFGEGIVSFRGRLFELTWKNEVGFIYDRRTLKPLGEFHYSGEGWALTRDDHRLIMTDGTPDIRFLDPETLKVTGRIHVTDGDGSAIGNLNEVGFVKGEILANIWQTDVIAKIDPASGKVVGWIDLRGLLSEKDRQGRTVDVLNGIAYDSKHDRLFVTGKLWPKLYEIRLIERAATSGTPSR